jgi:hypothetical protein
VVFPGRPLDPKADLQKRKAMPLFIVRWHLPTNRVTYGHPVDDQFCYSSDGNVSFILFQRTDGVPDIRRGYFVEDQYFGPIDAPRKLEGAEKEAFKRGFDEATCGPRAPEMPIPDWIDKRQHYARWAAGGLIVSSIGGAGAPRYCSKAADKFEQCVRLPFPTVSRVRSTYVSHLDGHMLTSGLGSMDDSYFTLIRQDQVSGAWRAPPHNRSGSPRNAVFTRMGLVELLQPHPIGGLFQVRGASRSAILRADIKTGYYLQDTVSADGCKVVFASTEAPEGRIHRATVASLCGD